MSKKFNLTGVGSPCEFGKGGSQYPPNSAIANGSASGIIISGIAGEALAFGELVYLKSDGKYWKAKADATATMPCVAMAVATILADATGNFLLQGYARNDAWAALTIGVKVYPDEMTAGVLTQTVPGGSAALVQVAGYAVATKIVYFEPSQDVIQLIIS